MAYTTLEDVNVNVTEAFKIGGIEGVRKVANRKIDSWKKEPVAIGITGASGVGKSSFINAYRGIKYTNEKGAAKVGVVQTTMKATPYPDPNNPNIVLYDLPGVGTSDFPQSTYLENPKIGLKNYDFVFIITANRFTEADIWLYREMNKMEKPTFLVRTKVMMDVENEKKSSMENQDKNIEEIIFELRPKYTAEMKEGGLPDDASVYFIDNHKPEHPFLDFSKLIKDTVHEVSSAKGEAILYSLKHKSSLLIKEKVEFLNERRKYLALSSGAVAVFPIPGLSVNVDIAIIEIEKAFYQKQLGLEKDQIVGSRTVNVVAMGIVRAWDEIKVEYLKSLILSEGVENVSKILIPGVGSIISSLASAGSTYFVLGRILQEMEKDALKGKQLLIEDLTDLQ